MRAIIALGISSFLIIIALAFLLRGGDSPRGNNDGVLVTGECLREVAPDRASIVLTAEFLAPAAAEASKKVNDQYAEFKTAVEELKIPDLRLDTQEFSVFEDMAWEKSKQVSRGFKARMGLKVKTSALDRMTDVIALASRFGIQNVGSLESYVSQERMKSEYEACLGEALKNAQAKAENLAKIGNRDLGDLRRVAEAGGAGAPPAPMSQFSNFKSEAMAAQADARAGSAPGFEASARMIKVYINAEYELD